MNYSDIISGFTWSYSRLTSFEMCPYKFFLTYIKQYEGAPLFFSDFGSFIHKIIEMYLNGDLKKDELAQYYLLHFRENVRGKAPKPEIFKSYFEQGLQYLSNIDFPYKNPRGVEERVDFSIDGVPFVGIIDCIAEEDDGIVILDNKSRTLKPRSKRKKPTKTDEELDEYLRQLYLYSIAIQEKYGLPVKRLEFNCFRTPELISEPFVQEKQDEAKQWAIETIERIKTNEKWNPDLEFWKCNYICDMQDECEYYQMNKR